MTSQEETGRMNRVHRRRRRRAGPAVRVSPAAVAVATALISLPPSRALRWLREASPRRRDAADAAFGPAPAGSQVLLDRAGAEYPRVCEDAEQGDDQQHRRQRGPTGVVEGGQERVLDDGPDHRVARAPEDLLVHVVAQGRDEREQKRREDA